MFLVGTVSALALVLIIGILSGRRIKTMSDFTEGGGKAGTAIVAGSLLGTIIGGASTIGTAQLAFRYGLSGWNFSLGCAGGCLLLALLTSKPVRHMKADTINGRIREVYGDTISTVISIVSVCGLFIALLGQVTSGLSMVGTLFPALDKKTALAVVVLFIAVYVIFGGLWGAGMLGLLKTGMLFAMMLFSVSAVLWLSGGYHSLAAQLDPVDSWDLFRRGINTDLGSMVSVMLGVACNQSYIQILRSGRSDAVTRRACLVSAAVIPPVSFAGVLVGLYMRSVTPESVFSDAAALSEAAREALPRFLLNSTPPLFSGLFLTFLFVVIIGSGAGLLLGMTTVIRRDLVGRLTHRFDESHSALLFTRVSIVVILAVELLTALFASDTILDITVYGTALRTSAALLPFLTALFLPGRITPGWAGASMAISIAVMLLGNILNLPVGSIFLSLAAGGTLVFAGILVTRSKRRKHL